MKIGIIILVVSIGLLCVRYFWGKRIKMMYISLNSFKDENLAYTFQHTPEIQPTKKISKGEKQFQFQKTNDLLLEGSFEFQKIQYSFKNFLKQTQTSGLLIIQDDIIRYENYFLGGNETTLFSSNSMGKSFISALIGIAVTEGAIKSIDEPIGKYIPEFKNTALKSIPIKACLQMASGIHFNEDTDMNKFSLNTLLGKSAMQVISKYPVKEPPFTSRQYISINTEILGEVLVNATGYSLAEYMEEKLWKKLDVSQDAYWTLSNNKELAMGGLNINLQDYAKFARLYLNEGQYSGEQIIPKQWIIDSLDISKSYSKPNTSHDSYETLGYGYQWWIPEGVENEFMAIGVYGQWMYINPTSRVIIIKTSADPHFMEQDYELKHVTFFRAISNSLK